MEVSGIYKIESICKPEMVYVGSAVNFIKRRTNHLYELRRNRHRSIKLQHHYNKYGESDLVFSIIEYCLPEFLIIREQYFIDTLNPWFNILKIAKSPLGYKHSEESKQKKRGNKFASWKRSDEAKQNMREAALMNGSKPPSRLGSKTSEETRRKQSESHKGKNTWMKGRTLSVETRLKMSIGLKGKNLGRKVSLETRLKMSESHKNRKVS